MLIELVLGIQPESRLKCENRKLEIVSGMAGKDIF